MKHQSFYNLVIGGKSRTILLRILSFNKCNVNTIFKKITLQILNLFKCILQLGITNVWEGQMLRIEIMVKKYSKNLLTETGSL